MPGYPDMASGGGPSPASGPAAPREKEGLSRKQRLTRTSLFQETYRQGRNRVGRYMVLWLREGPDASLRLGVVASRKVGGAVARARAKRLLRESFRRNRDKFSGPFDVVLVARRDILKACWPDLVGELLSLANKAGLVTDERTS